MTPLCAAGQEGTPLPDVHWPWAGSFSSILSGVVQLPPYLYPSAEALQGTDVQPFLAGLQAGDNLLTLHFPRADGETGQAAVEELGKPRFGDFSS